MNFKNIWMILSLPCIILAENQKVCLESDIHALILARGGSKGIKYKNLAKINGLSLLSRSISAIRQSGYFEQIWVSTDDIRIGTEGQKYGAIYHRRPFSYAMDNSSSIDAVKEFLGRHQAIQNLALFQCTSVFLKPKYIKQAISKFKSHECVFAVKSSKELRWKFQNNTLIPVNFNIKSRPRRQDWIGEITETGMFYFVKRSLAMSGLLQNEMCSAVKIALEDALEIDTYHDLRIARCLQSFNTIYY